jgi:hypothetical protein
MPRLIDIDYPIRWFPPWRVKVILDFSDLDNLTWTFRFYKPE